MNILLLSPVFPYPLHDGLRLRIYHLFKILCKEHHIVLCCFGDKANETTYYDNISELFIKTSLVVSPEDSLNNNAFFLEKITNIFKFPTHMPANSLEMHNILRDYIDKNEVDSIYCVGLFLLSYITSSEFKNIDIIVDLIDSPSLFLKRSLFATRNLPALLRALKNYIIVRRWEERYLNYAHQVITVSKDDANDINQIYYSKNVKVVPNGVDTEYFKPKHVNNADLTLLFTGAMNYEPNIQAVYFFCKKILPSILKLYPNLCFHVVGKSPPKKLIDSVNSLKNNVIFTGFVEDTRPYFNKSTIYVCPMISGTGIKNKLLEAFAMEIPVIATSLACQGINVKNDEHLLIADDCLGFVNQISKLIEQPVIIKRITAKARELVEHEYSWEKSAWMVNKILLKSNE